MNYKALDKISKALVIIVWLGITAGGIYLFSILLDSSYVGKGGFISKCIVTSVEALFTIAFFLNGLHYLFIRPRKDEEEKKSYIIEHEISEIRQKQLKKYEILSGIKHRKKNMCFGVVIGTIIIIIGFNDKGQFNPMSLIFLGVSLYHWLKLIVLNAKRKELKS
ncbi:MAG: hypothetical protein MJA31_18670 [Clostridia bacterium]|nr:hypothetical protein [Clostridia bacterium]